MQRQTKPVTVTDWPSGSMQRQTKSVTVIQAGLAKPAGPARLAAGARNRKAVWPLQWPF